MLKILEDSSLNRLLLDQLKEKWPQINDKTNMIYVTETKVSFGLEITNDTGSIVSKSQLKTFIQSNTWRITTRNRVMSLVDKCVGHHPVREETHHLIPFIVELYGTNREIIGCYYRPETDSLYIKPINF